MQEMNESTWILFLKKRKRKDGRKEGRKERKKEKERNFMYKCQNLIMEICLPPNPTGTETGRIKCSPKLPTESSPVGTVTVLNRQLYNNRAEMIATSSKFVFQI